MTSDVALRSSATTMAVPDKLRYAQALAESGLLPAQYRRQPANLLYAIEYAEMLGTHPLTAVTGVFVIDGKPSASAGLISALVRRAGHKLRVTGDAKSATAQIIRADDPDFTFEVTFTMEDAKAAGLASKNVWKQYPAAMLKARAITQVARDACEDALSGLHYTAEELGAEVTEEGIPLAVDNQAPPAAAPSAPPVEDAAVVDGELSPRDAARAHDDLVSKTLAGRRADRGPLPADEDPWQAAGDAPLPEKPPAVTDTEWLTKWREQIVAATTTGDLTVLWKALVSQQRNGHVTDEDMTEAEALWNEVKTDIVGTKKAASA